MNSCCNFLPLSCYSLFYLIKIKYLTPPAAAELQRLMDWSSGQSVDFCLFCLLSSSLSGGSPRDSNSLQHADDRIKKPQVGWNHINAHADTHTCTHTNVEEAEKLKEAMVTNHFPCSAITNHSTLHWGSLHPGLEWHLETVEGGLFNSALCWCYYCCLSWEQPISTLWSFLCF